MSWISNIDTLFLPQAVNSYLMAYASVSSEIMRVTSLEDLKEIITRPKNAISKQYKALFSFEGVEFEITEDGREQIAQLAVEKKIGARGLRSIMEKLLLDCMYDIPDKDSVDKVVLSKESVISNRPIIVYKEKTKIKKKVGEN